MPKSRSMRYPRILLSSNARVFRGSKKNAGPDGGTVLPLGRPYEGITAEAPLANGEDRCADCRKVMNYAHKEACRRRHGTSQKICGACKAARQHRYDEAAATAAATADEAEAPAPAAAAAGAPAEDSPSAKA